MTLRFSKVGALLVVAIFGLVAFVGVQAFAQEEIEQSPITLAVSPQLLELTANPGERITNTFRLTNGSQTSVDILATPKNFLPSGEEGAVELTEDDTTYAIANWTTTSPASATLTANSTQDFEVTIDVPANAEPGSHFGSVVFSTVPPDSDTAAAVVSQEIAPVILVAIAGDLIETTEIEEFKSDSGFYSNEDSISFISRLRNTGTVHFKPTGQIVIKNIFGSEVAKLDLDQRNVLPGTIRQITTDWDDFGFLLGRYTAELTIVTGEDNQISTSEISFVVFPYQVIVPIAILLGVLVFILYKGRKRIALAAKALSGKDGSESSSKDK